MKTDPIAPKTTVRILVGIVVTVLAGLMIGWGSWVSSWGMANREMINASKERIVILEVNQAMLCRTITKMEVLLQEMNVTITEMRIDQQKYYKERRNQERAPKG